MHNIKSKLTKKNWVILPSHSEKLVQELSQELKISPTIAGILINRGYNTYEKAEKFLNPKVEDMHNPFLMRDMDKAVSRIIKAIKEKEKILIYGDYDVDGTTGVALLYLTLKNLGADVNYYIPHRLKDGYGLTESGVRFILQTYVNLIITVDCGIGAVEHIKELNGKGIDVIIVDHHEAKEEIPLATAILNPGMDEYPFKELVGCGIALKLAQALYRKMNIPERQVLFYLDLVALATVCDIAPIVDENRIITKFGMIMIQHTKNKGLKALLELTGLLGKEIDTYDIGFILGPRINAQGRLDKAGDVVEMLITEDEKKAFAIAKRLDEENKLRIGIQEKIVEEARRELKNIDIEKVRGIVLASSEWHPGVIGIAASKIAEEFYRPTVLISIDGDIGRGSGRAIPEFNLYESLKKCESFFENFGGHKQAAGLVIKRDRIEEFKKYFNEIAQARLNQEQLTPKIFIDKEIHLKEINQKLIAEINRFIPTGLGNPNITFLSRNVEIVGYPVLLKNKHLKFKVRENNNVLTAIAFGIGELNISMGNRVDIVYQVEEGEYLDRKEILLKIKDMDVILDNYEKPL